MRTTKSISQNYFTRSTLPIVTKYFRNPHEDQGNLEVMFCRAGVLYSYGLHVPLATYFGGCFYLWASTGSDGTRAHTKFVRNYVETSPPSQRVFQINRSCPITQPIKTPEWFALALTQIRNRQRDITQVLQHPTCSKATRAERVQEVKQLLAAYREITNHAAR